MIAPIIFHCFTLSQYFIALIIHLLFHIQHVRASQQVQIPPLHLTANLAVTVPRHRDHHLHTNAQHSHDEKNRQPHPQPQTTYERTKPEPHGHPPLKTVVIELRHNCKSHKESTCITCQRTFHRDCASGERDRSHRGAERPTQNNPRSLVLVTELRGSSARLHKQAREASSHKSPATIQHDDNEQQRHTKDVAFIHPQWAPPTVTENKTACRMDRKVRKKPSGEPPSGISITTTRKGDRASWPSSPHFFRI